MSNLDSKLALWKTRLLDLSRRNRLLYLHPSRRGQVKIIVPPADDVFAALVHDGHRLTFLARDNESPLTQRVAPPAPPIAPPAAKRTLPPDLDTPGVEPELEDGLDLSLSTFEQTAPAVPLVTGNDEPPESAESTVIPQDTRKTTLLKVRTGLSESQLTRVLYDLRGKARTALEEQGVNVLFLSFGVLEWIDPPTNQAVQSPLLLVPVQLQRSAITQPFTLELRDEEILLNPTLAHKLQIDFGLALPRLPEEGEPLTPSLVLSAIAPILEGTHWSLAPDIFLDLFSFEKLVMLKDLESHAKTVAAHPIIQSVAGQEDALPLLPPDLLRAEELDDRTNPLHSFQVLDADSSQQVAIEWAKRGVSFVIEGPPGTGKSQTIANIISESLAQNKKVLFVSAKMAALEIVYKRLADCGLGVFCLEAHSHRASRGAIVAELGKTLLDKRTDSAPPLDRLAQLAQVRRELNDYARELHTPVLPLLRTPFQVQSELAPLASTPDLIFDLPPLEQVDAARFERIGETLDVLAAMEHIWEFQDAHPWRGVALQAFSPKTRTDIEFHLSELIQSLRQLGPTAAPVADALTLTLPESFAQTEQLAHIAAHALTSPLPPSEWFRLPSHPDLSSRHIAESSSVTVLRDDMSPPPLSQMEKGEEAESEAHPPSPGGRGAGGEGQLPSPGGRAAASEGLRSLCLKARQVCDEYRREWADFSSHYAADLVEHPTLRDLVERFETAYATRWRVLDPRYRQDMAMIRAAAIGSQAVGYAQALRALKQAHAIQNLNAWMDAHDQELRERLGRFYRGDATQWQTVLAGLDWVERMIALFGGAPLPDSFIAIICNRPARVHATQAHTQKLQELLERIQRDWFWLEALVPTQAVALKTLPVLELIQWLQVRLNRVDELEPWILFQRTRQDLAQLGLAPFLQSAQAARLNTDQLKSAFLKRFYHVWLDWVTELKPILATSTELRRKTVAQFCRDDIGQLSLARTRLAHQLASLRPSAKWNDAPSSEVTILKRELAKRKHHKSIRRLFSEIPNLLLTLKPCLMMSPLSVSQYLAAAPITFDVVIFDEASQLTPEDTIGAIARGKQVIVAGDHQQLPPTPFFQSLGVDETPDLELTTITMESILQETSVILPSVRLLWHYRSRHESLLAFSNHHFYQDRLVTFPNATRDAPHLGVEFIHVPDGIYDRARTRQNPIEAQRVVELVLEHFAQSPDRSLGVVTFSQAQREAIDSALEAALHERPELEKVLNGRGSETFFVKSLENVQGDERDVMFFSIGYGRDEGGTLTMNFGPLNGEDGERRLNVAITRAREQVKVISSILPTELSVTRSNSRGVRLLRRYMDYVWRKGNADWMPERGEPAHGWADESLLIQSVEMALSERGLVVNPHVGAGSEQIDLGIADPGTPGRYVLGIELDGATFLAAKTARDRERLRQQVLESLGWRIHRLYSRDWVVNPAAQVERILNVIASLETPHDGWSFSLRANSSANLSSASGGASDNALPMLQGTALYSATALPRQGTPEQFYRADERTFEELFVQLAEREAPIHWNAAVRRIAACWGIQRVTPAVERHLERILSQLVARQIVQFRDDFIWSPHSLELYARVPSAGQEPRAIEEISVEEISQAALLNLQNALSLTEDDLVNQTAHLLGYTRATERVRRRIGTALERLDASGVVQKINGKLALHEREFGGQA